MTTVTSAERAVPGPAPAPVVEPPRAKPGPTVEQVSQLLEAVREMFAQAKMRNRQVLHQSDQGRLHLLFALEKMGPQRPSALAKEVHLDLSTVSRHLRQLEDEGMIAKTTDADDKRAFQVQATEKGARVVHEFIAKRVEQVHAALGQWTTQDVTHLTDLLHRFVGDIEGCFK
jgi:DNA-binding MarR family transcriptional regulator